ncbi:MAG: hypothetical protein KAS78_03755 [Candidatus Pacebacteria bacterium]|nr:hypothetical protein [Candidatus Paceibacterota bacterium]
MKKLFNKNLLFLLFFALFSAQIFIMNSSDVFAQVTCGPALGIPCNPLDGTVSSIPDTIIIVIRYLLFIIGIITLIFIVISGIKYIASTGNEEKMKSAKDSFHSSVFGLALALMAYVILKVIVDILNA